MGEPLNPLSRMSRAPLPHLVLAGALERIETDSVVAVGERSIHGENLLTEAAACIREMVEWRPIETAPRDGTVILTYGSLHNDHAPYGIGETPTVKISQFSPEHGAWCCDAWGSHEPVWWKPLPLPPAPGAEA